MYLPNHQLIAKATQACLFSLALLISTQAAALEDVYFSGFATIGAGKLDRDDVKFVDYDGDWRFKTDSVIGGQAHWNISNRWSATTQVVAKGFTFGEEDSFEPSLEWLFASYQWSPETRVRFGRLRTPLYLYSDSLEVGYSYPWVRPPVDTYAFVIEPLGNFDGIDITTVMDLGEADLDLNFLLGRTDGHYLSFDLNFELLVGGSMQFRWHDFTFRYGLTFTRLDASSSALNPIVEGYQKFAQVPELAGVAPLFSELADSHSTENGWFQYHGLGVQWDYGEWSFIGEQYFSVGPNKDFANDAFGWNITIARQIGQFVPYAVAGYYKNVYADETEKLINQSIALVPEGLNASLDGLRQLDLGVVGDFNESGHSYTIGVRYDFHAQAAIKFEAQYFDSTALLSGDNLKTLKQEAVLTSVAIDVVF